MVARRIENIDKFVDVWTYSQHAFATSEFASNVLMKEIEISRALKGTTIWEYCCTHVQGTCSRRFDLPYRDKVACGTCTEVDHA